MKKRKGVLFLCVANSARSQLAEGLSRHFFDQSLISESAGSSPSGKVQPLALKVLEELDAHHSFARSKSLAEIPMSFMQSLDFVITLCDDEICPTLAGTFKRLHWPFKDPVVKTAYGEILEIENFRRARDDIYAKLKDFVLELELASNES